MGLLLLLPAGAIHCRAETAPVAPFRSRQSQPQHTARLLLLVPAGTIPPSLARCSSFVTLDLTNNSFSGTIPPNMGNIQTLTYMMLSGNRLTGQARTPAAWACYCAGGHLSSRHFGSSHVGSAALPALKECANGGVCSAEWHPPPRDRATCC